MAKSVQIVEVGPRDGLQNEAKTLSIQERYDFVMALAQAGLNRIEAGAFVSPEWVPQMAQSRELILKLYKDGGRALKNVELSALVPNVHGMQDALQTPLKNIAIFGACSETFSKKNINCSIDESFERFEQVMKLAKAHKIRVRGYLSTAFGCPYEGDVPAARVVKLTRRMLDLGVHEVSIGDTIGVATPKPVRTLIGKLKTTVPLKKIAMHFHDTRGTALANVLASLDLGIRIFDSSMGGLGGCPYAKGASGNLATEDLVYMLNGMGLQTGVDLKKLAALKPIMEREIGKKLPSKAALA